MISFSLFFPTAEERKVLNEFVKNLKIDECDYTWEVIIK